MKTMLTWIVIVDVVAVWYAADVAVKSKADTSSVRSQEILASEAASAQRLQAQIQQLINIHRTPLPLLAK